MAPIYSSTQRTNKKRLILKKSKFLQVFLHTQQRRLVWTLNKNTSTAEVNPLLALQAHARLYSVCSVLSPNSRYKLESTS